MTSLQIGDIIVINPPPKQYRKGEPWLGKVRGQSARTVRFEFYKGSYKSGWKLGVFKEDTISKSQVECVISWDESRPMPNGLVRKLRNILDQLD